MDDRSKDRLQKIMAHAGIASRRKSEELIRQGRVTVNGRTARLGDKADPDRDRITVDGKPIEPKETLTYVALHKPKGVLSHKARRGGNRPVAGDLIDLPERLYPVGRLDLDSEGLMLFTNDGKLTQRLTHPRYEHKKVYRVLVKGRPADSTLDKWRQGVFMAGRTTAPARVKITGQTNGDAWLRVTLREGRKHQIRRVGAMLGHRVKRLIRVRIGPVALKGLKPGQWRRLSAEEIEALERIKARPRRKKRLS